MVRGLEHFKKYFEQFPDNYIIIGGTACDIIIDEAGFVPRATKDIDIILVVEALSTEFVKQFWQFINEGKYQQREKGNDEREYYRFIKPENKEFPHQIELFSRVPDTIALEGEAYLTPIPVGDDLSSLSAILLNDDYYYYILEHSTIENGLHHANMEALICLKAKAFLDIKERIERGSKEDIKHLRKHKGDVFRLMVMIAPEEEFVLPEAIQNHITSFADLVSNDLPDSAIFKEMGLGMLEPNTIFEQFKKAFRLIENRS